MQTSIPSPLPSFSQVNYDLLVATLEWISSHGEAGAILVFMPGLMEISRLAEAAAASPTLRAATRGGATLVPLHSALAAASTDTALVFDRPPAGCRWEVWWG